MSNLKTVLGVYGSVFVSLLIVGAVQGSAGRNAGAKLFITQNLFLKQIGQTDLGEARFGLTYSCEEYPNSHVYDVESKSLVMSPDYDFAVLSGKLKGPMADLSSNRDLLLAFAGGPTGVMTLTWMSELKKSNKKPGTITYTILSALGGYLFGYWFTSEFPLFCDSPAALNILNDEKNWPRIERLYVLAAIDAMGRKSQLSGKTSDPLFACSDDLQLRYKDLLDKVKKSETLGNAEFTSIKVLSEFQSQAIGLPIYQELMTEQEFLVRNRIKNAPPSNLINTIRNPQILRPPMTDEQREKLAEMSGRAVAEKQMQNKEQYLKSKGNKTLNLKIIQQQADQKAAWAKHKARVCEEIFAGIGLQLTDS